MSATVKIDWMKGWGNAPRIILEGIKVPEYPAETDPIWEKLSNGLHVARKGVFVFYFYSNGKPTEGYGGRRFAGTFKEGTTFEYKGAWSSRAGCVNPVYNDPIVDVVVGSIATAVTVEFLDSIWDFDTRIQLFGRRDGHDFTYEPTYRGLYKRDEGFTYPE
jgi:hypothetical protein